MTQGQSNRVVSMFPRSNTGQSGTPKRPLPSGESSEQGTKRYQRLQKGPQAITTKVSSPLPREARNPWERYQKVFKIDQAGPSYIAHAKNNTFAEMIVKEVKAPSKNWLTKLTSTSNQNVVHLQEAMFDNDCIYLFYEVMDVSLSQAFATPLGRLKAYEVAAFSQELLHGLDYIHKNLKLVHGDITANCVLLSVEGAVKIANIGTSMLQALSSKTAQADIRSVGRIIIECLEPSTFLENGDSLISDSWDPVLVKFLESTKSDSIQELLRHDFLQLSPGPFCLKPYIRLARELASKDVELIEDD
ncbi:kinase-like protein [Aspergillus pseudonomiae]|uniref:Kinase-like protein n=1 Tax=Aspergillus pseudonomiae TaxID=1506151 RepID=A0A5N7D043_9EURO|nr:kinase-like protein [Aspergillus pseudonomiae]KAE8399774.1 kinase-like protein [Aspergillus pseudonomiae]